MHQIASLHRILYVEREHESFDDIKPIAPPAYFFNRVINRINTEKELVASKRKAAYFSIALAGSATLFSVTLLSLGGSLIESEVLKLLSVFVSDPGASLANWQDSGLFFLESLPVAHLALFLVALLAVLQSLKYVAKYTSNIFSLSKPLKIVN